MFFVFCSMVNYAVIKTDFKTCLWTIFFFLADVTSCYKSTNEAWDQMSNIETFVELYPKQALHIARCQTE